MQTAAGPSSAWYCFVLAASQLQFSAILTLPQKSIIPSANTEKLKDVLNGASIQAKAEGLLITWIVCQFLERRYADQKINWDLCAKKAKRWVRKESASVGVAEDFDWDSLANKFLSSVGIA